jgi:hypothetical protein
MAFRNCTSLTTVTCPGTIQITRLGDDVFGGCPRLSPASRAAIRKLDELAAANSGVLPW